MTTAVIDRPGRWPQVPIVTRLSGLVAAAGVAFLLGMFAAFAAGSTDAALALGRVNDVLVLIAYLLAIPAVLAMHGLLRRRRPRASAVLALTGIAALVAIVVLQALLVAGVVTFEEQVGAVSTALLVIGAWFVIAGRLGAVDGVLPGGARMGLLAATYLGYPVWALWFAGRLNAAAGPTPALDPRATTPLP